MAKRHTFATAMERCNDLAKHGKIYPSSIPTLDNNFNNNLSSYGANGNNNEAKADSNNLNRSVYNYYPRPNDGEKPVSIGRVVNNDPAFLMAKNEWGVFGGTLTNYCKRYGITLVRQSIRFVASIGDGYFHHEAPIGPQRGAYLNTVLNNGGPDEYHLRGAR